ncbi:unnamed protein product [Linum trigynum]|uniref:Uncharacterized protein n=1 Tax=Linum trigynum TaxID=586398 RepID=A0AAV2FVD6_9ROSI
MYGLRDPIFTKYKDLNERINHPPPQISPSIWMEMVQKWTDPNWVEMSDKNEENREKSELAATGGSAPLPVGQGNDEFDDESDEETADETAAA